MLKMHGFAMKVWILSTSLARNIEEADVRFIRRMTRISWTENKTNLEVIRMAGTDVS